MKGTKLLYILIAVTWLLWILSKKSPGVLVSDPLTSLSQVLALTGLLLMMVNLTLSTRLKMVEDLWGGLDKVYEAHHLTGKTAFFVILAHPLLLAVQLLPDVSLALQYAVPGSYLPYNFGIFAVYVMLFAFLFILAVKLPYHWWKRTHQVLGLAALFAGIHAYLIPSDIAVYLPLRIWMMTWVALGNAAFLYIFFFYNRIGDVFVYRISKVEKIHDVVNITAVPRKRKIVFEPGQFAYVSFPNPLIGSEQHPFSFSSAPGEESVRICAKAIGDYTSRLHLLKEGDVMYVKGPYGRFGRKFLRDRSPLVWIAGGIGITPFLSMLRHREIAANRKILLYYSFRDAEGIFAGELKKLTSRLSGTRLEIWDSSQKGRFTVSQIQKPLALYGDYTVQLCGPVPMMENLEKQFRDIGVRRDRIVYEKFLII
jgi:predicted ferric reductase